MRLNYHLLDVFSNEQFGGNQLAVFHEPPPDLTTRRMQQIAQEMNLSEVTFVFPPEDARSDYRLRIFTPAAELPMAGHPTIGSAYALAYIGALGALSDTRTIVFEEGVGPIGVTIHVNAAGQPAAVWMRQPTPEFLDIMHDRAALAQMLSLEPRDLMPGAPPQVVSSGLPFLFVPLNSLEAIARVQLRAEAWRTLLAGSKGENIFVTTTETVYAGSSAHSRMFAPALGVSEDPATGSASGPLGAYLRRYGLSERDEMVVEQGFEMGRKSLVHIRLERENNTVSGVAVGGDCAYVGYGTLLVD